MHAAVSAVTNARQARSAAVGLWPGGPAAVGFIARAVYST